VAIDANSYCAITDLERRVSDLIVDNVFTTTTRPTLAQAEQMIDDVAAEINNALLVAGFTAPIAVADDPFPHASAVAANSAGAAVKVMNTFPSESWDPNAPEPTRNRISGFAAEFKGFLEKIEENKIKASRDTNVTGLFIVGSARDRETGALKTPAFKRNEMDYPGRVTRTDSTQ
jgi:hypothetical protein